VTKPDERINYLDVSERQSIPNCLRFDLPGLITICVRVTPEWETSEVSKMPFSK